MRLWTSEELIGRYMHCDNVTDCGNSLPADVTWPHARVKGWHLFAGHTEGGEQLVSILCPACVGQRSRLPRAPDVLPGQEQLF